MTKSKYLMVGQRMRQNKHFVTTTALVSAKQQQNSYSFSSGLTMLSTLTDHRNFMVLHSLRTFFTYLPSNLF